MSALLLQGNAYYAMDDFSSAAGVFEKYLQKAGTAEQRATAAIALGQTYESQSFMEEAPEKLDDALTQYEQAVSATSSDSYLHALALMNQARVFELQGKNDQALAIYKSVVETRDPPREAIPGAEDETEETAVKTGNPFMDNLFNEAVEGSTQMNFRSQAQARIDQLEAASSPDTSPEAP